MGRGPSIENRKNAEDAKRGKIFTKLIREITVAARNGGDPATNARLRIGIEKALASNMTKDTIERAVKRGSGAEGADGMEELRYEGYGPGGVALIIDAMTDNAVRTVADVRHALSKHGGNLGTSGSVAFQFSRIGELVFETRAADVEEKLLERRWKWVPTTSQRSGLEHRLCAPENFESVKRDYLAAGFAPISDDGDASGKPGGGQRGNFRNPGDLLEWLDELDDVQDAITTPNCRIPVRGNRRVAFRQCDSRHRR